MTLNSESLCGHFDTHKYPTKTGFPIITFKGEDFDQKIPANNRKLNDWKKNLEKYGAVLAPRTGSKGRVVKNVANADPNAPNGSKEHRLALKRGHYDTVIPECRGYES